MIIDEKWLKAKGACSDGMEWFISQGITEPISGLKNLIAHDKLDWANWLIVRVMKRKQYLAYAIFAAEQVIGVYEKKYPNDDRPRKAITAAKFVLKADTREHRNAAYAYAAYAAYAAAYAAYAAYAAAYAAYAYDAYAAAYAAYAYAAAYAAASNRRKMKLRILNYGLSLLEGERE